MITRILTFCSYCIQTSAVSRLISRVFYYIYLKELQKHARAKIIVCERSSSNNVFIPNAFARGYLTLHEKRLLNSWYGLLVTSFIVKVTPDHYIYLRTSPEICISRLTAWNRVQEKHVGLDYLLSLHHRHESCLASEQNVITIQTEFTSTVTHNDCISSLDAILQSEL